MSDTTNQNNPIGAINVWDDILKKYVAIPAFQITGVGRYSPDGKGGYVFNDYVNNTAETGSAAFGTNNKANQKNSFVIGKYNNELQNDEVFVIGWGEDNDTRKNIIVINNQGQIFSNTEEVPDNSKVFVTKGYVDTLIENNSIKIDNNNGNGYDSLENLPTNPEEGVIYLVNNPNSIGNNDKFLEYLWINNNYELLGGLDDVDIREYAKITDIPTKTSDLTNDSDFITQSSVPTNVSELENDSGYITIEDTLEGFGEAYIEDENSIVIPPNVFVPLFETDSNNLYIKLDKGPENKVNLYHFCIYFAQDSNITFVDGYGTTQGIGWTYNIEPTWGEGQTYEIMIWKGATDYHGIWSPF